MTRLHYTDHTRDLMAMAIEALAGWARMRGITSPAGEVETDGMPDYQETVKTTLTEEEMVDVSCSRFTPGLKNAESIRLRIGDTVTYRLQSGKEVKVTIQTERRCHEIEHQRRKAAGESGGLPYGYEAIFSDDGQLRFADEQRIIDWEGKA